MMRRPLVIAHRGASAIAAENSAAALETAIGLGADLAEVDVRLSRDGVAVCCHDPDLGRTTRLAGRVDEHDATALTAAAVPALIDILALARGRIPVLLDCKLDGSAFWRVLAGVIVAGGGKPDEDVVIGVRSVAGAIGRA